MFLDTAPGLAEGGWGGRMYLHSFIYAIPLLSMTEEARYSLDKIVNFAETHGGQGNISALLN